MHAPVGNVHVRSAKMSELVGNVPGESANVWAVGNVHARSANAWAVGKVPGLVGKNAWTGRQSACAGWLNASPVGKND